MEIRKNLTALIVIILFGIFLWVGSQTEEPTKRYSFKEESQKTALENKDSDHNSKEDLFFDEFFDEEPEVLGEEIELDEFESQSIDSGFNIPVSSIAELEKIELKYVIDGDTIKLADNRYLRLIGIDAPEKDTYFFSQSRTKLEELLSGKTIYAEKDISESDRFGRLLRYLWVDGKLINLEIVRLGYAYNFTYPPDVKYSSYIIAAQKEAQKNHRGLW